MTTSRRLRLRVEIAGCPVVLISDSRDAGALSDGRTAVSGLLLEGMALEADLDPVRQELETRAVTLQVVPDRAHQRIADLLQLPSVETYITQDVSDTDTRIYVESNAGITAGQYVHIGIETVQVTAVGTDATGDYLDVVRAQWGTVAVAYYAPTADRPYRTVAVSDRPSSYTGRRAHIYVWSGSAWRLEWRGMTLDGWRHDGDRLTITVDGLAAALEASAAPDSDEVSRCTNASYPHAVPAIDDARVRFADWSTTHRVQSTTDLWSGSWWRISDGSTTREVRVSGWYATHADFAAALESAMNSALSLADHTFSVVANDDGSLGISMTIAPSAATPTQVDICPPMSGNWISPSVDGLYQPPSAGTTYEYLTNAYTGPVQFSRPGFLGANVCGFILDETGSYDGMALVSDGYVDRIRLDSPVPAGSFAIRYRGPAYVVTRGAGTVAIDVRDADVLLECTQLSATEASVRRVLRHNITVDERAEVWLVDGYLRPGSQAALQVTSYAGSGWLGYALQTLVDTAVAGSSLGHVPSLYVDDFHDLYGDAARLDDGDAESPLFGRSRIAILDGGTTVAEWLSHELRARGEWLCVDAEGRLWIRDGELTTETTAVDATLDESVVTVDEDWPAQEMEPWGRYTRVDWRDGYDPVTDDYTVAMSVVDYRGAALTGRERSIDVRLSSAPLHPGTYATDVEVRAEIVDVAAELLARWSRPYMVVEVVTGWPVRLAIGDVVRLQLPHLPDPETGRRGSTRVGRVIGFRRDLDRASCRYRILLSARRSYGYTPSVRVTSYTLVSGTTYDLTVSTITDAGVDLVTGLSLDELYPVGARVRARSLGSTAMNPGTVQSVTGSVVQVTFDAVPSFGTGTLYLVYHDAPSVVEPQEAWAYIADATGAVPFASGSTPARRYQP